MEFAIVVGHKKKELSKDDRFANLVQQDVLATTTTSMVSTADAVVVILAVVVGRIHSAWPSSSHHKGVHELTFLLQPIAVLQKDRIGKIVL